MSSPEYRYQTPENQLWEVAFACADRKESLEQEQLQRFKEMSQVDTRRLGAFARELYDEKQQAYWDTQHEVEVLRDFETGLLDTLDKLSTGIATTEEIGRYLPREPTESEAISKRRRALLTQIAITGQDPRNQLDGLMSWDLVYGSVCYSALVRLPTAGRLTTGRNQTRFVTSGAADGPTAVAEFLFHTTDSHGGIVRGAGKNGRSYVTSAGKRIRKR